MANAVYPEGLDALLSGDVDVLVDTIKVQLVSSTYVYSVSHDFFDDVTGTIHTPTTLAGKSVASGVFSASDAVFSAVAGGSTIDAYVVYKDTGVAATSPLLAYVDTLASSAAISVATNGGDVTIDFSSGNVFSI